MPFIEIVDEYEVKHYINIDYIGEVSSTENGCNILINYLDVKGGHSVIRTHNTYNEVVTLIQDSFDNKK